MGAQEVLRDKKKLIVSTTVYRRLDRSLFFMGKHML